jgi:hypothetical protein
MSASDPTQGDDDEQLLRALGSAIERVAGPPPHVLAAARAALSRRLLDHELAQLLGDAAERAAAGVRTEDSMRLLSFRSGSVAIEIEINTAGDQTLLRGHVSGAGGDVVIDTASGEHRAAIGADGWFQTTIRPSASIRLRLVAHDGARISTSWMTA